MSETKPSILLVEDEYLPAIHLKTVLSRSGHEIIGPASSSEEAIDFARANNPDIILMDIRLAGQEDGIETARKIAEFSKAKVIFMSGYQERELRDKAMLLDPLAFLVKPVLLKDILSAIARYKGRGK